MCESSHNIFIHDMVELLKLKNEQIKQLQFDLDNAEGKNKNLERELNFYKSLVLKEYELDWENVMNQFLGTKEGESNA